MGVIASTLAYRDRTRLSASSETASRVRSDAQTAAHAFGYKVLGPILTEYLSRLWQFQNSLPRPEEASLLFCARGGLRLQELYQRFLLRTGLDESVPSDALMVSRLVAARMVALNPTQALLDELGREFHGQSMAQVAACLAQAGDLDLSGAWNEPYRADKFVALLSEAQHLRALIADQNALFRAHLDARSRGKQTLILSDTGLYGSTVRLLRDAIPERNWLSLQFARSNYKAYPAPHFDVTVGLSVERDIYAPWDLRSCVLRFWHLIESVLEPELPSVRSFASSGGEVRANLEVDDWRARIVPREPCLFSGAMAYVDALTPERLRVLDTEAVRGWQRLRRTLLWPRQADLAVLTLGDRSHDFGRRDGVAQFARKDGTPSRLRASLWREGALIRLYPRVGVAALPFVEVVHVLRALHAALGARHRRSNRSAAVELPGPSSPGTATSIPARPRASNG